ncbi:MAG: hypothetical protein INR65_03340 [Gluconacetobacter diazotrophicus]|nr:hypothetical protein [Gluconacetobacter diazotrophicus]
MLVGAFRATGSVGPAVAAVDPRDGHILGAKRVCGMPFIEGTMKDRPAYRRKAVAPVRGVTDPELASAWTTCLFDLDHASQSRIDATGTSS